jgi:hypothetical protein
MDDLISRKWLVECVEEGWIKFDTEKDKNKFIHLVRDTAPSAQPTLYGYKIEHLAYIARVMEKEGITAEDAVRTFDDISRAVRMIIEEAQQKAEEMLNERLN